MRFFTSPHLTTFKYWRLILTFHDFSSSRFHSHILKCITYLKSIRTEDIIRIDFFPRASERRVSQKEGPAYLASSYLKSLHFTSSSNLMSSDLESSDFTSSHLSSSHLESSVFYFHIFSLLISDFTSWVSWSCIFRSLILVIFHLHMLSLLIFIFRSWIFWS